MYRGTTPTLCFKLPRKIDAYSITQCDVTFAQMGLVKFIKEWYPPTPSSEEEPLHTIEIRLTQGDTLSLEADKMLQIQLRCLIGSETVLASQVIETRVGKILQEGIFPPDEEGGEL